MSTVETEDFWAGPEGTAYTKRNEVTVDSAEDFFGRVFSGLIGDIRKVQTAIELGANRGHNLLALKRFIPWLETTAVEINGTAIEAMWEAKAADHVIMESLLELGDPKQPFDLVLTKGVLIHIWPASLPRAYDVIHRWTRRYILLAEYYAPTIEMINYRGQDNRLWKGPHAEHMLKRFEDLRLVDYGFVSKLDPHPQDDITFWLLEKNQ